MLVSAIILTLFFWAYFADVKQIGSSLLVSELAAGLAGGAFLFSFISYLWSPKKNITLGVALAYILLCATTAILILDTGGAGSPFIALWMLVAVFAGVFGWYALIPLFIATLSYMIWLNLDGALTREVLVSIVLAGELPLVASFLIWHGRGKSEEEVTESEDKTGKAYKELAAEYSQVSGKSDTIIGAIADGVIALNSKGTIQFMNPAAERFVGWSKQDAISLDYKSVLKLVDKKDAELTPANDPISNALVTNKEKSTNDLSLLTKTGKKILVSMTVSPAGQPGEGAIVVFRDITKEKAEEREQAEFISTASHEMRTPVASIEGYLGLALNPNTAQIDDKARDYINKAHESAQHLGRLFQDLLDVSKAEDGRLANNPKVVDIVAFTRDIVEGLRPQADKKQLRLIYKPIPDDGNEALGERRLNPVYYANVDNDHLREILSNLIENGIKYTPKGDVTVDIGGDAEHVVISVADSGIGIPKEDIPHLFQKFYRVDNTQTREIGGTGLGLYLSRRLVEAMNGRLWVESEYQRGSTFFVELPRISHEDATRLIEAASIAQEETPPQIIPDPTYAAPASAPTPSITPTPPIQPEPQAAPPAPAPNANEAAFVSPPADQIAKQLQSQMSPPVAQPEPTPLPPSARTEITPSNPAPYTVPRVNTPLSSIERDPSRYLRPTQGSVNPPPRQ